MNIRRISGAFVLLAATCLSGEAYGAFSHNNVSEYSSTANPNGVWEYRYTAGQVGGVDPLNSTSALMTDAPADSNFWQGVEQYQWIGGALAHPGNAVGRDSLYTFVYPAGEPTSAVAIHVDATDSNSGGDGQTLSFWLNDTQLGTTQVLAPTYSETLQFDFTPTMSPGDRFYMRIGSGSNGSYNNDGTNLNATFTTVPEPTALGLLTVGGMTLLSRSRRR